MAYNSRRNIFGAISLTGETPYHLYNIGYSSQKSGYSVKLLKQSKWQSRNSAAYGGIQCFFFVKLSIFRLSSCAVNHISDFDFNPAGETVATIDSDGICLISDINTDDYAFHIDLGNVYRRGSLNPIILCCLYILFMMAFLLFLSSFFR